MGEGQWEEWEGGDAIGHNYLDVCSDANQKLHNIPKPFTGRSTMHVKHFHLNHTLTAHTHWVTQPHPHWVTQPHPHFTFNDTMA